MYDIYIYVILIRHVYLFIYLSFCLSSIFDLFPVVKCLGLVSLTINFDVEL